MYHNVICSTSLTAVFEPIGLEGVRNATVIKTPDTGSNNYRIYLVQVTINNDPSSLPMTHLVNTSSVCQVSVWIIQPTSSSLCAVTGRLYCHARKHDEIGSIIWLYVWWHIYSYISPATAHFSENINLDHVRTISTNKETRYIWTVFSHWLMRFYVACDKR